MTTLAAPMSPDTSSPQACATASHEPRVNALLVDDDLSLARALCRTLTAGGVTVTHAPDGRIAEQLLRVRRFDVILTDLNMPEVGGLELAALARAHDPAVAVLLMTGDPTVDSAIRAVEVGAVRYLVKPSPPDLLMSSVSDAARLTRQRRSAPELATAKTVGEEPLEQRFDRALERLWMAYQPIFSNDGQLFGYEALVRTDEPSMKNPAQLLEAADRLHRIHELSRRIRQRVGETISRSPEGPQVFVNLHPLDLLDEELYSPNDGLYRHARRVVLEITERAALDDQRDLESRIARLRELGFRVAVDDLGAGYAGLTTLARLTPEVVKIDMSLIRGIDTDPVKQKMVGMVSALSHELGATVVGEGVETDGERKMLATLGCDLLQGYLLGRPARKDELAVV